MNLRTLRMGWLLLAVLYCTASNCAVADAQAVATERENVSAAPGYEEIAEQLSQIVLQQLEDKQLPAVSIAIVADGEIVWAQGFGLASPTHRQPATALTVYRVGSISKLFTDIALMQLVERGALDLDAPVETYLPEFRPHNSYGTPLTCRQLASHTAGLVREPPVGHYFDPSEPTLADIVNSLNETTLVYAPGTRTKYSNAGVTVLGYIVERLSDRPFVEVVQRAVMDPVGMPHSSFQRAPRVVARLAEGKMWSYDGREFAAPQFDCLVPAGNLYSTVVDLGRFMIAMMDTTGTFEGWISANTRQQMMAPQSHSDFGIGFHVSEVDGHRLVGHGGAIYGFSTQLHMIPDRKIGVVVAASQDVCNGSVRRLANHALQSLLAGQDGKDPPRFEQSAPIPSERCQVLDGLYHGPNEDWARLVERNGTLTLLHGEFERRLRMAEEGLVADDVFGLGPAVGRVGADEITISGRRFQRIDESLPADPPARWQGLLGEYGWDHDILFVYERQGQLYCLIEWVSHYPLSEIDRDTFAFPDFGLYHGEQLRFVRGDDDRAEAVIAAGVRFQRRNIGTDELGNLKIQPTDAVDNLRRTAMAASPPFESGDFRQPDLVELVDLDDSIKLDIRYATTNNFMGSRFYQEPRAFLQRPAAEALVRANQRLHQAGYGLLVFDAYRPWHVTKMFWDGTPEDKRIFVADPQKGSRHNRGCAVDLTLYELATEKQVPMGGAYDEFTERSFPDYVVTDSRTRWHRELLRDAMEAEGFTVYQYEWWHFDYRDWQTYPILNLPFSELRVDQP